MAYSAAFGSWVTITMVLPCSRLSICSRPRIASAEEILGLLQTLNREHGKTIVMVTHDPKAAEYATHTLHLDKGNLVESAAHA